MGFDDCTDWCKRAALLEGADLAARGGSRLAARLHAELKAVCLEWDKETMRANDAEHTASIFKAERDGAVALLRNIEAELADNNELYPGGSTHDAVRAFLQHVSR